MWVNLTDERKLQVLEQVENAIGLPAFVVMGMYYLKSNFSIQICGFNHF